MCYKCVMSTPAFASSSPYPPYPAFDPDNVSALLREAAVDGDLHFVKHLLGSYITDRYALSCTLDRAAEHGHLPIVEYLVKNSGDANNVLALGAEHGHLPIVKFAIENGADIKSGSGDHALRFCTVAGHLPVLKYLMENGGYVATSEQSLLDIAAERGHLPIMRYLLEIGSRTKSWNLCQIPSFLRKRKEEIPVSSPPQQESKS